MWIEYRNLKFINPAMTILLQIFIILPDDVSSPEPIIASWSYRAHIVCVPVVALQINTTPSVSGANPDKGADDDDQRGDNQPVICRLGGGVHDWPSIRLDGFIIASPQMGRRWNIDITMSSTRASGWGGEVDGIFAVKTVADVLGHDIEPSSADILMIVASSTPKIRGW